MGIITGALLALLWHYNITLFGIAVICILLCGLFLYVPVEEEEVDLTEVQGEIQEQVRAELDRSLRKRKAKYIENALAAYEELYGKDAFYVEIWNTVYKEFYKEKTDDLD